MKVKPLSHVRPFATPRTAVTHLQFAPSSVRSAIAHGLLAALGPLQAQTPILQGLYTGQSVWNILFPRSLMAISFTSSIFGKAHLFNKPRHPVYDSSHPSSFICPIFSTFSTLHITFQKAIQFSCSLYSGSLPLSHTQTAR